MASRRASDRLIQEGRVEVNGQRVDHPGTLIHPGTDRVTCRGQEIRPPETSTYVLLNKPPGYLVSAKDPHHTRTVFDLLEGVSARVFPVGRLDLDTRGILLLTDDGDLAYRLTHPRYEVAKVYRALVYLIPSADAIKQLRAGVELEDGMTAPAKVRKVAQEGGNGVLELVLHEGRKRQVKRMCEAVGHRVHQLERISFAGLNGHGLESGKWRYLSEQEVVDLKRRVGLEGEQVRG